MNSTWSTISSKLIIDKYLISFIKSKQIKFKNTYQTQTGSQRKQVVSHIESILKIKPKKRAIKQSLFSKDSKDNKKHGSINLNLNWKNNKIITYCLVY